MSVTKKPLVRYKILDACFKNPYKNFTKDNLLQTVNEKLMTLFDNDSQCIKLRQLQDDIAFMKSSEGWGIELADIKDGKRRIYRYESLDFSINNAPLNEVEINQIQSAILVLAQFEGIQEIIAKLKTDLKVSTNEKPFVGFDKYQDLKGIEYFSILYNAVQHNIPLQICYQDFKTNNPYTFILHPYYLKEYNNRWFMFGLNSNIGKHDWNVAIDRILSVSSSSTVFIPNEGIDWKDYFSDMIGVSKTENANLENITLHFNKLTGKYMENKSMHETQKHKWLDDDTLELKVQVIINYELERLILSYGESVKVIMPIHLKSRIKQRIQQNLENYE